MVNQGDRVGIIGGNGCGKSTLSKILLGIHRPRAGEAFLFGRPAKWTEHFADIGYIGDPGHNAQELGLPTKFTIRQVVNTLSALYGNQVGGAAKDELVERLGLSSLYERKIGNLSTGERKRLMACLTFLRSPKLIILDEPFDGLDKHIVVYIQELMSLVMGDTSTTIFLISHSQIEIDTYCNRVYLIRGGGLERVIQHEYIGEMIVGDQTKPLTGRSGEVMGILIETLKGKEAASGLSLSLKSNGKSDE